MKKILVLFTGGTIGSITTDGIIDVEREGKYAVVEAYKSAYGDDVEFECRQVLNILSENMGFSGWEKMIHEINSIDTALYSGVILTHGSDTLAYTSALLGMYFRHFDIPLFIIASNKPIGEKGSNGLFNFTSAVGLIKEGKYKGVFTLYERVMLPTRVIPADTCRDRFGVYGYDGFNDFSVFSGVSENMLSRPREQLFTVTLLSKSVSCLLRAALQWTSGALCQTGTRRRCFTLLITVRRLALTFQKGKAMH